ncbi:hypothetical protein H6503_01120 [Candidatus Woesearchaeota archaeon]|nr:hypothetical protein [Candidatus Woesearchaeota archaeon]
MRYKMKCNINGVKFQYKGNTLEDAVDRIDVEYKKGIKKQKIHSCLSLLADIGIGYLASKYEGCLEVKILAYAGIMTFIGKDLTDLSAAYLANYNPIKRNG